MKYMMSPKEMGRLSLIQGALDGVYTVRDANSEFLTDFCAYRYKKILKFILIGQPLS
jgi:hypothetical protein